MECIKEIRQNLGLSRKEFSELYKIPYNTLAQWERGERSAPGYVIKLIEEIIRLKTKGEQLKIEIPNKNKIYRVEKIFSKEYERYKEYYTDKYFTNKKEAEKELTMWGNMWEEGVLKVILRTYIET